MRADANSQSTVSAANDVTVASLESLPDVALAHSDTTREIVDCESPKNFANSTCVAKRLK
jgi:hypothetical protein